MAFHPNQNNCCIHKGKKMKLEPIVSELFVHLVTFYFCIQFDFIFVFFSTHFDIYSQFYIRFSGFVHDWGEEVK